MSMSRPALLVGIGVVLAAGAAAALIWHLASAPQGLVADPAVLDFGTLPYGQRVTRTVRLRNATDGPVTIGLVGGNCSCIHVRTSYSNRLAPGEVSELTVDLISGNVPPGTLSGKAVRIPYDPGGLLQVPVKAVLEEVVRVNPTSLDFGAVAAGTGSAEPKTVQIRRGEGYVVRVQRAEVEPKDVFEARRAEVEGGVDVVVALRPGAKGVGRVQGSLKLGLEVSGDRMETKRDELAVPLTLEWR